MLKPIKAKVMLLQTHDQFEKIDILCFLLFIKLNSQ